MQFSDITSAVHDAWTFVWPPLCMLLLVYLSSRWLSVENTDKAISSLWTSIKASSTHLETYRTVLEVYGLAKLIPIISFISVIAVLYLLNGPIIQIASNLPPYLSFTPEKVVRHADEEDRLLLLRKYPTSNSFGEAYSFASEELAKNKDYNEIRYDRVQIHYKVQNFLKCSIALFLIFAVVHIINGAPVFGVFLRLIGGLIIVAGIWFLTFSLLLYNQEQQIYDEWRHIQISLQPEAKELLKEPVTEKEKEILESKSMSRNERWWRLSLYNSYYIKWSKRTFFGEDM